MMFSALSLSLLNFAPLPQSDPLRIEARMDRSTMVWAVPLKCGEKVGYFAIATQYQPTMVSKEWLEGAKPELTFLGRPVGETEVVPAEQFKLTVADQPIAGFIGCKALKHLALGFDMPTKRITVWTNPTSAKSEEFIGGDIRRIPIARSPSGTPLVKAKLGGKDILLVLSSTDEEAGLRPELRAPEDVHLYSRTAINNLGVITDPRPLLISQNLTLDGVDPLPVFYHANVFNQPPQLAGLFPVYSWTDQRVVLDFASDTVILPKMSTSDAWAGVLYRLAEVSIRVRGERLVFGPMGDSPNEKLLSAFEGHEVRKFAGIEAAEIVTAFQGADPMAMVKRLVEESKKGFSVEFVSDPTNRKLGHITVPPRP